MTKVLTGYAVISSEENRCSQTLRPHRAPFAAAIRVSDGWKILAITLLS